MSILSKSQCEACERGVETANNVLPRLEYLEKLTTAFPSLNERVQQLRQRRDYLHTIATAALELDNDPT